MSAKRNRGNPFWVSFSDLMTSLFFIMLVLYIITFVILKNKMDDNIKITEELENVIRKKDVLLAVYNTVEKNLEVLKDDDLFKYDKGYKRYLLSFEVYFKEGEFSINEDGALIDKLDKEETTNKIEEVGKKLERIVDVLVRQQASDPKYKNISYLIVISGSASNLPGDSIDENYLLSYKRAYYLYKYWKSTGVDFDSDRYHDIIDLQISGVGEGGIGRFQRSSINNYESERKNQRFIINIVPKIGKIETK